jgi:formylglycine-generating enzyme required for sulfatase activity
VGNTPAKTTIFKCSSCGFSKPIPAAFVGRKVKCPRCGEVARQGEINDRQDDTQAPTALSPISGPQGLSSVSHKSKRQPPPYNSGNAGGGSYSTPPSTASSAGRDSSLVLELVHASPSIATQKRKKKHQTLHVFALASRLAIPIFTVLAVYWLVTQSGFRLQLVKTDEKEAASAREPTDASRGQLVNPGSRNQPSPRSDSRSSGGSSREQRTAPRGVDRQPPPTTKSTGNASAAAATDSASFATNEVVAAKQTAEKLGDFTIDASKSRGMLSQVETSQYPRGNYTRYLVEITEDLSDLRPFVATPFVRRDGTDDVVISFRELRHLSIKLQERIQSGLAKLTYEFVFTEANPHEQIDPKKIGTELKKLAREIEIAESQLSRLNQYDSTRGKAGENPGPRINQFRTYVNNLRNRMNALDAIDRRIGGLEDKLKIGIYIIPVSPSPTDENTVGLEEGRGDQEPLASSETELADQESPIADTAPLWESRPINSIGMEFKKIPAGTFTMGSPAVERGRMDNERQYSATISSAYWLGMNEVTQSQYERVMGTNPSKFKGADHPVETVSWEDAVEFCRRLSELPEEKAAGRIYRLPTEAEWEYACRAGSKTAYSFGSDVTLLVEFGWFRNNSGNSSLDVEQLLIKDPNLRDVTRLITDNGNRTHPVGQKKPNAWGLYDMHGNVSEWCSDWLGDYPVWAATDPVGLREGSLRVLRGGSWFLSAADCRSAGRHGDDPSYRFGGYGFRVVLSSSGAPR